MQSASFIRSSGRSIGFFRISVAASLVIALWAAPAAWAGNIFDDGWTPPKRAENPTLVPPPPKRIEDPSVAPPKVEVPIEPATLPAAPARPAPPPFTMRPFPSDADLARSRRLLKEVFAAQMTDASMAGRRKLARVLLDEAPKIPDNPSDQYALILGGFNAAEEAGSLPLCFEAVDVLSRTYAVDALRAKTDAALSVALKSDSIGAANANVRAALPLVEELIDAEDFASASKLCGLLRPIITGQPDLAVQINKRMNDIRDVSAAIAKLRAAPADPAANLAMGRYFCLVADRWDKGLPLLAQGADPELKGLAKIDLSNPTSLDGLGQLGDGWWTMAAKQPQADRPKLMQHAAAIYQSALTLEGVTGLRRALMEKRIAEAPRLSVPARPGGAGATAFINSLGMKFALIPAGEFIMGSPLNEPHHHDDETEYKVRITRAFELGTHHVTRGQFAAFVKASGYKTEAEVASASGRTWKSVGFEQNDNHPVVIVSWNDAAAFCQWLSKQEGKKYRLPTEAEYEYACRAGTATAYPWGNDPEDGKGWCNAADLTYKARNPKMDAFNWSDGFVHTSPVGSFRPNAFGLYDMIGNALEWCGDYYAPYPAGDGTDPKGPQSGEKDSLRVLRGGSYCVDPEGCRAAHRFKFPPRIKFGDVGFRCVLEFNSSFAPASSNRWVAFIADTIPHEGGPYERHK